MTKITCVWHVICLEAGGESGRLTYIGDFSIWAVRLTYDGASGVHVYLSVHAEIFVTLFLNFYCFLFTHVLIFSFRASTQILNPTRDTEPVQPDIYVGWI